MRSLIFAVSLVTAVGSASAQQSSTFPTIGPNFAEAAVNADKFDAVFNTQITTLPAVQLLMGQPAGARLDAVICNAGAETPGWVKVDAVARWGVLDPGRCTMFSNFADLKLATSGDGLEWSAKIFLRAHR